MLVKLMIISFYCFALLIPAEASPLLFEKESSIAALDEHPFGEFRGEVSTKWLPDGRKMELLDTLVFVDARGKVWDAPKGHIIDGASIPQEAWSLVGGPYSGKYRNASVIHDVACDRKDRPWQLVHLVFYEAMLASGVPKKEADTKYFAVQNYGPRWGNNALEERLTDEEYEAILSDPKRKSRYIEDLLNDVKASSVDFSIYIENSLFNDVKASSTDLANYIENSLLSDVKASSANLANYVENGLFSNTRSKVKGVESNPRGDFSSHLGLIYSQITIKNIMWALGIIAILGMVIIFIRRTWMYALGLLLIISIINHLQ